MVRNLAVSNAAEAEASILRRGLGIRRKVQLIERRDGIAARCKTIENLLPRGDSVALPPGAWPGLREGTKLVVGQGGLCVKRPARLIFGTEYHIVGTFSCAPAETS